MKTSNLLFREHLEMKPPGKEGGTININEELEYIRVEMKSSNLLLTKQLEKKSPRMKRWNTFEWR